MFDATPSDAFCVSQCVYIHPHLRKQTPRELGEKSLPTTRRPKKNPENINTLWNGMCIRSSVSCHDPPWTFFFPFFFFLFFLAVLVGGKRRRKKVAHGELCWPPWRRPRETWQSAADPCVPVSRERNPRETRLSKISLASVANNHGHAGGQLRPTDTRTGRKKKESKSRAGFFCFLLSVKRRLKIKYFSPAPTVLCVCCPANSPSLVYV